MVALCYGDHLLSVLAGPEKLGYFYIRTAVKPMIRSLTHLLIIIYVLVFAAAAAVYGQQENSPSVVRPGAPGQPTRTLPSSTRAKLPPASAKDVEFMQGMIMHHAQAVEMTALIDARSKHKELRLLGARISQSQSDEMRFMTRWLQFRGQSVSMPGMSASHSHGGHGSGSQMMMPGMLTAEQMAALKAASGDEFDRLFLSGMIQHHEGALVMVDDLFTTAGAGQDAELFNFATDVDSGQRAEIKVMKTMLGEKP